MIKDAGGIALTPVAKKTEWCTMQASGYLSKIVGNIKKNNNEHINSKTRHSKKASRPQAPRIVCGQHFGRQRRWLGKTALLVPYVQRCLWIAASIYTNWTAFYRFNICRNTSEFINEINACWDVFWSCWLLAPNIASNSLMILTTRVIAMGKLLAIGSALFQGLLPA